MLEEARSALPHGAIGGRNPKEAEEHFLAAFSGSCARLKLAVLDPKGEMQDASNLFLQSFSGGSVSLMDLPCGAGAATAALLGTIAELRRREILPALPLDVYLVGGDISARSLGYAGQLLTAMEPELRRRGIRLYPLFAEWNILDANSTTGLLRRWMEHTAGCREHFLLVANCSGFLHDMGKFKEAKIQLEEVFRWAAERQSTVAWMEPQTDQAMKRMWPMILGRMQSLLARFIPSTSAVPTMPLLSAARFRHPLVPDLDCDVRVSLTKLSRHEP